MFHAIHTDIELVNKSLEDNSSALFFDSCRALMRSKISFDVVLCGSPEVTFRKNYRSIEADCCGVFSCVFSSSRLYRGMCPGEGGSGLGTPSP